ncbi:MAG: SUMF1/EgtB/PvdO family nonheme iron enzyme [Saprospiraceae bacterium]|nr:SUMF1/EgtB/PvdO family nonheme iron enzyme [Saprospiraceae bacterium]MCB9344890.1 SUMF1/EgtB/PvdO family nonheme iron enzyme [Lewinellaceae bacterium]
MKKLQQFTLILLAFVAVFASCGRKEGGQLVGSANRPKWKGINPYGMVYVPSGQLHIGVGDEDLSRSMVARPKSISIQGFFMDDTEITNNEYRQFVDWVTDSIAHRKMDHIVEDTENDQLPPENQLDWSYDIDWEGDAEGDQALEDMYYQGNERFAGRKEIDVDKLVFEFQWYDWQRAAHDRNGNRTSFIHREKIKVYPDTLTWVRDYAYSYNEPMTRNYFWHPAFDDYPVVGVNWKMAKAFCYWRSKLWDMYGETKENTEDFRLPTEHEWEYAARGGRDGAPYPWGAYYTRNAKGCLLANFKPGRGNYPEDGGLYTVKADGYYPNDYGLYCMAGNVAEWTETAYFENSYSFMHDLNPDVRYDAKEEDEKTAKRKVIRGGSWKDVAYFLQTGNRSYEYQDTTKCYIGFRCVLTFLGRSINDF